MSRIAYFGRDGIRMQRVEWMRMRADKSYAQVRLYDNGQVSIALEWLGLVNDPCETFPDFYKLYLLSVGNYNAAGVLKSDPVEDGKFFPDEKLGIQAYEAFLERWTASHRDEEGGFVEEDNDLTPPPPPPPPNPDAPTSEVASIKGMENDDVGAW